MNVRRSIAVVLLALGWISVSASFADDVNAAQRPDVVRYRFVPGQEITYRSNWLTLYWKPNWREFRTSLHEEQMDFAVWILRANPDGSYRMVVRVRDAMKQMRNGIAQTETPPTQLI